MTASYDITHSGANYGTSTPASSMSYTVPSGGVPSGALMFVASGTGANSITFTISDNAAGSPNTYIPVGPTPLSTTANFANATFGVYLCALVFGNPTSITLTPSVSAPYLSITVDIFTGFNPVISDGAAGQMQYNPGSGTTNAVTSGTFSMIRNNDLVYGAMATYGLSANPTPGTGFTSGNNAAYAATEYNLSGAAGSSAATWTATYSGNNTTYAIGAALAIDPRVRRLPMLGAGLVLPYAVDRLRKNESMSRRRFLSTVGW